MRAVSSSDHSFLNHIQFFSGLRKEDRLGLLKSGHLKTYNKNAYLYHHGDKADRFFVITSGWVKLYRDTIDGEEAVSSVLRRGDIFGEGIIFYQSDRYLFSAQAVGTSRIFEIPERALRQRAEKNPDILKRVMKSICEKLIQLQVDKERLFLMTAPERAACLLLQLSSHMVGNGGTFTLPYDKSLAASQLGMKRETFSRALRDLSSEGVLVDGPEVTIKSFERLAQYGCKQCTLEPDQCAGARYSANKNLPAWEEEPRRIHSFHGS